jgi:uncharacterized protein YeaO (DUF488 family)
VPKSEFATRDFYDVWLPELAPTAPLVSWAFSKPWTPARWRQFEKRYRAEMSKPAPEHLIATLAALSYAADFSVGCYCEDATYCHRSLLAALLQDAGAALAEASAPGANVIG